MVTTESFLEQLRHKHILTDQVVHVKELPEGKPVYKDIRGGLCETTVRTLASCGIDQLYSHQAEAIEHVREGEHVVTVTGTASGKTLCYVVPVLEALQEDSRSTTLFLYPTKALAQDQLRTLNRFQPTHTMSGTYDGDTPQSLRRRIRDGANLVLTNPDMLHQGILPQHTRWNRFFTHLRYVIIDEIHAYRGVFGSHLANVIRRLARICRHYGAEPQFICSSATIANPKEHAERICGVDVALVDNDGSPRGPKRFVLWNPPSIKTAAGGSEKDWRVGGDRRSPVGEAVELMTALVQEGIQTIAFVQTRLAAELIFKSCRDRLRTVSKRMGESIHAYRGGYLPEERREIERKLSEREIMGVSSTNALELGIDIGSLDACILVGYPGTVASMWQQAGRAGRGLEESVVILVAQNAPMDQYLMTHPDYLFAQNPEYAVVDPDNPHVMVGHVKCATQELPLTDRDSERFGPYAATILDLLEEDGDVRHIENVWYWASSEYPATGVSLRNIAGPVYTIQDEAHGERVIGTVDQISALSQLHDHAVYLHGADTYFVNRLDLEQKVVYVERQDLDYYTQAVQTSQIQIEEKIVEESRGYGLVGYGDVNVTTSLPMFKKIRFHSRDSIGFETLELPPQLLETVAFWFMPSKGVSGSMLARKMVVGDALVGLANVLVEVAPLFVMCDTRDIGAVVDSTNLSGECVFVHDRYPGGMGYARRCLDHFDRIMRTVAEVIQACACADGCPSCVGSATTPESRTDLDSAVRGRIPDKKAAQFLVNTVLENLV